MNDPIVTYVLSVQNADEYINTAEAAIVQFTPQMLQEQIAMIEGANQYQAPLKQSVFKLSYYGAVPVFVMDLGDLEPFLVDDLDHFYNSQQSRIASNQIPSIQEVISSGTELRMDVMLSEIYFFQEPEIRWTAYYKHTNVLAETANISLSRLRQDLSNMTQPQTDRKECDASRDH